MLKVNQAPEQFYMFILLKEGRLLLCYMFL